MRKSNLLAGLLLVGIAGLPMVYFHSRLKEHDWAPLSTPVDLTTGKIDKSEFIADLTGTYIVSLAFSPTNSPKEECLLGDNLFRGNCRDLGSGLDLDWSVTRSDLGEAVTLIDNETYIGHAFGGSGGVQTELGRFGAQAGGHYRVSLLVRQSDPELRAASPFLKVDAHWVYWEKWIEYQQLSFWFAVIVGVTGIVNLIRAVRTTPTSCDHRST
jgi:hypothetical protein